MKLVQWTEKQTIGNYKGYMLQLSRREALLLVQSLSNQLVGDNPNSGRLESFTEDGEYFSVSVSDDKPKRAA